MEGLKEKQMNSTTKWILGVLIAISIGISGYVVGHIKEVNTDLQQYKLNAAKELQEYKISSARDALALAKDQVMNSEKYVLKEDYKCDIGDLKKQLGKMDDKLDSIIRGRK